MFTVTTTQGRCFESRADETLLDAALRQGVGLEYSCRIGRCRSCKGRLHSGATTVVHDESGLSAQERGDGWILTCSRQAASDVHLAVEDLGNTRLPVARTAPCRVQMLERLAPDVMKVVLRLPPSTSLDFLPGQYLEVIGPDGNRRSYSMANAPRDDKRIELHVREVPHGTMSAYWFRHARADDLLRIRGPFGTFFLRQSAGHDLAFLATGTGIAPVKAMLEKIRTLPREDLPRSVSVFWGGRRPTDHYLSSALLGISLGMRYVPVLSRADVGWQGARGHVQHVLLDSHPDLSRTMVYACGSDSMIHSARALLVAEGLPEARFRSDAFVCSAGA